MIGRLMLYAIGVTDAGRDRIHGVSAAPSFIPHDVHFDVAVGAGGIQLEHRGHLRPIDR